MSESDVANTIDWVADRFKFFWLWGLPTIMLIGVMFLNQPLKKLGLVSLPNLDGRRLFS